MADVIAVEGIGEVYGKKLKEVGIRTSGSLLEKGSSRSGRQKIEETTGISGALVLRWVNHVDLFRIRGVQKQYAELLEASGVDSVPELSHRVAAHLHAKMVAVNAEKHLVRKLPGVNQVAGWIEQAKSLPKIVTH
jgi:predicted flap endonuclease-1-like 5' DNA nuclease